MARIFGLLLMVAALALGVVWFVHWQKVRTLDSGEVWFFSRARNELWHKGDTSGQFQQVVEMRIDCDQDAVLVKVLPQGDGGVCHVGFRSCFYRVVEDGALKEQP